MRKRKLHLITGPSGSGKSWLCHKYARFFEISTDNFYLGKSKMKRESDGSYNFDAPEALDLVLCRKTIEKLLFAEPGTYVDFPEYDMTISERKPKPLHILVPSYDTFVILEGIFAFHVFDKSEKNDPVDFRIWLDVKAEILLGRRFRRDIEERARSPKSVLDQYMSVIEGYHKYVEPKKAEADLLLPQGHLI